MKLIEVDSPPEKHYMIEEWEVFSIVNITGEKLFPINEGQPDGELNTDSGEYELS